MIAATANLPVENFTPPPGIIEKKLNLYNDRLAPKNAKKWRTEVYADYANPPLNENSKPKKSP
jgi:membrane carboxypeptidase/penicillin-binding protein